MTDLFQVKRNSPKNETHSINYLLTDSLYSTTIKNLSDTILWVLNSYPNPIIRWAFLLPITACTVKLSFEYVHPQPFSFAIHLNSEDQDKEYHSLQIHIHVFKYMSNGFFFSAFNMISSRKLFDPQVHFILFFY